MVDLGRQLEPIKSEIDSAIQAVLEATNFIQGQPVRSFETNLAKWVGSKHVVSCANGTDALQLAMMALGLKPGDEVITTNFTYVATAEIIALLQLKPVLVDVHPDTFNIDISVIEKVITSKTKAIVPVHLFGQCSQMEELMAIAKKHNLFVVEDTAQALGADYIYQSGRRQKAGTIGDIGTTSFFPSKNLGCMGDGGALFTNDDDLALKIRMIANHGQSKQYYHDLVGVNSRLDTIQAAILRIKLKNLDEYCALRANAAKVYDELLIDISGIISPVRAGYSSHVFHQYVLKTHEVNRDGLINYLKSVDIPCNIYYPVPLNEQKPYMDNSREFPVTKALCQRVFALPIHTELDYEQQEFIVNQIKRYLSL